MASNPKSSRSTRYVIWGLALIVLVAAVYAVRSLTHERVPVHVDQVTYGDVVKTTSTNGRVEASTTFQAHAVAAGQVREIYVEVGEKVKAGQLLLKMDDQYALASLATRSPPCATRSLRSAMSIRAAHRKNALPMPRT